MGHKPWGHENVIPAFFIRFKASDPSLLIVILAAIVIGLLGERCQHSMPSVVLHAAAFDGPDRRGEADDRRGGKGCSRFRNVILFGRTRQREWKLELGLDRVYSTHTQLCNSHSTATHLLERFSVRSSFWEFRDGLSYMWTLLNLGAWQCMVQHVGYD